MDIEITLINNMPKMVYEDIKKYSISDGCLFVRLDDGDDTDIIIPLDKILMIKIIPTAAI